MLNPRELNPFKEWPWLHWNLKGSQQTAILIDNHAKSWADLCADIANARSRLPVPVPTFLALESQNTYQTLVTMLAAWEVGIQTLMLNPTLGEPLREELFANIGIEAYLSPDNMPEQQGDVLPSPVFDISRVVSLTLTSGSTGLPKAVAHTAKNHLASAQGLFALMPFERQDCWLLSLPLFHVSGLAIVWRWLSKGAVLKIANTQGDALSQALEGATHASLVPTQLQRLLDSERSSTLHSVLLGGAVIPQDLVDSAEQAGIQCWCGYGMTEMASTITAKRANGAFSVGKPMQYRELMLSNCSEVLVRGETLSPGYVKNGQLDSITNDWFATKDKGDWENGELKILGRLDNMFICGGENVQPEMAERVLGKYDGIRQIFILPLPDAKWGQVPVAIVDGDVDVQAFLAWAKVTVSPYQCPTRIFPFPQDVLNGGIKVSRRDLQHWLANITS
ncbi:o-succinylbenzoate--CoA ligase [Enterovibrio nigricans]|uniref:O-succinylbenzoic acid--CoA ligase n=1 Tax=Enterovibrio nigricans DSM 22720 TaxID=1121868 RepID=A0A1T4USD4_9GAMM|nr:o-succinylbenzoate--CoA ligase [Enterovibrio nigricans]SKA55545.1 O-succinylbenzoic acid--CoA ligase [Enterovibrio nigricans DSM 22720]